MTQRRFIGVRPGTKTAHLLQALADRPHTCAQLAEVVDDITPCLARTMAALRHRGLVRNQRPGMSLAMYEITDRGRASLARVVQA